MANDAGEPLVPTKTTVISSHPGHTQWVSNVRAAGSGELQVGRRVEESPAIPLSTVGPAQDRQSGSGRTFHLRE